MLDANRRVEVGRGSGDVFSVAEAVKDMKRCCAQVILRRSHLEALDV